VVWYGLWKTHVLEPSFFEGNVTGETYLIMLNNQLMPALDGIEEGHPEWFQQDGAPPHYARVMRDWLDDNFQNWIGRRGRVEWAARSLDLGCWCRFRAGIPSEEDW
jgi:hypothetical protein